MENGCKQVTGNVVISSETNKLQMRYKSGHLISEVIATVIRIMMSRAMIIAMLTSRSKAAWVWP